MIVGGARTPMAEYVGTPGFGKFKDISAHRARRASREGRARARRSVDARARSTTSSSATRCRPASDAIYGARHVGLKAGVPEAVPALTVNRLCGSRHPVGRARRAADPARRGEDRARGRHGEHEPGAVRAARRARGLPLRHGQSQLQDLLFARAAWTRSAASSWRRPPRSSRSAYGIPREAQDEFALRSHQLGAEAVKDGRFAEEIVPDQGEEGRRARSRSTARRPHQARHDARGLVEAAPGVRQGRHRHRRQRVSGIVDGAAAVVVSTRRRAEAQRLDVLARDRGLGTSWACEPQRDGHRPRARDPRRARSARA